MDLITLALAVDSTQVTSASAALDKFAVSGSKAEGAANRLAVAGQKAALSWKQFQTQRLQPLKAELFNLGVPGESVEKLGLQQLRKEWDAYKRGGVAAQEAVQAEMRQSAAEARALGLTIAGAMKEAERAPVVRKGGVAQPLVIGGADTPNLNALAAAAARADAQASALGNTLRRDVASGAAAATSSVGELSRATAVVGATGDMDRVNASLGTTATKAGEATREVNALRQAIAQTGTAAAAGGGGTRFVAPAGGLRESLMRQPVGGLDPRLAASATAAAAGAGTAAAKVAALGKAGQLSAFQMQQLGFQLNDFFVQIASGGAPLTAFIQQGSQLSGTFGGAGNAFRAITSLITPMRLAIGGAAASVGVLALAMGSAESAARDLNTIQAQLAGQGRRGSFSTDELREFLAELSRVPGVSRDTATAIVTELSKAKDIGAPLLRELALAAADYARATGQEAPEAAKQLAKAFADPERGAKQLDETLDDLLSSTQLVAIEGFAKLGDKAAAQAVLLDALKARTKGLTAEGFTPLKTATDELSNAWDGAMRRLSESQGLKTLNDLLAITVKSVAFLVQHSDKIGGLGDIGAGNANVARVPSTAGPFVAAGNAAARFVGSLFGKEPAAEKEAAKQLTQAATASTPAKQGIAAAAEDAVGGQSSIKRALDLAQAYKSQAGQIAELKDQRKQLNDALKESIRLDGKAGEAVQKRLRDAIAGVNERITAAGKKGAGKIDREPDQIRREELAAKFDDIQAIFDRQRNQLSFQNRFLQGEYQAGEKSLSEYFDKRRELTEKGIQDEIDALEKRKVAIRADLDTPGRVKDPSERLRLESDVDKLTSQQAEVRERGTEQTQLANQEAAQSFKALSDQVLNYRANLLQLQGDEIGAAKIRAQIAIEQASTLAKQTAGTAGAITPAQVQSQERALQRQVEVQRITEQSTTVLRRLQIEEERIAIAQRTGSITTLTNIEQVTQARTRAVSVLEEEVQKLERLAEADREIARLEERPINVRLQLDTERARLELEQLRAEVPVLTNQFNEMFKDAGSSFLTDLMEGRGLKSAFKQLGESISRELNAVVARELSEQAFGKGGIFGGAGGFLADIFGKKDGGESALAKAAAPTLDTSAVTASLSNLQTTADPAANALVRLEEAANSAVATLSGAASSPVREGELAARPLPTGEQSVMDLFQDADRSAEDLARTNALASTAVAQLANAASKGGGALSMLPGIINAIQAASAASGASSGSGGIVGAIVGAFSGGGGTAAYNSFATDIAAYGGLYSKGGYTGDKDVDAPAGIVHGKEFVFSAPAVKTIGRERLQAMHQEAAKEKKSPFEEAERYHTGGIVKSTAAAASMNLKPNEVPAVLMGGPKGQREEVLTAEDPRHRDNLTPKLAEVFAAAPRYHTGGLVGMDPDRPALLAQRDRRLTPEREDKDARSQRGAQRGDTIVVNVTQPAGAARDTGMQFGAAAGRQIQHARRRNG